LLQKYKYINNNNIKFYLFNNSQFGEMPHAFKKIGEMQFGEMHHSRINYLNNKLIN